MSSSLIQDILFQRLVDQGKADEEFALYVLAACDGPEAIDRLADNAAAPARPAQASNGAESNPVPPTYLSSIQVRSFRGIGEESPLPLTPGPGVTLIVGRNGSGKSSFAEGAEVAFTGTSARWSDKGSTEWLKGWRNVHAALPPRLSLELVQEGSARPIRIERMWADADDFKSGRTDVVTGPKTRKPLAETGWMSALEQYRPFLSYSELGGMLAAGPSRIYQALLAGLGLEEFVRVRDCLATAEGARGKQVDESRKGAAAQAATARALADAHPEEPRFAVVADLLAKRNRDIEAVSALVTVSTGDDRGRMLETVTSLQPPIGGERLAGLVRDLRDAAANLREMRGRSEGLVHGLSKLLREALAFAQAAPADACPVCGSERPLDAAWQVATADRLKELDKTAGAVRVLEQRANELATEARACCAQPPAAITLAAANGLESAAHASARWTEWSRGARLADAEALAAHLEEQGPALLAALEALMQEAAREATRRDAVWRPFANDVALWVAGAHAAARARVAEGHLSDAKAWVAAAIEEERQARFAPVKAQAIGFWNTIAQQSNVKLQDIELTGHGNQKRVALKVTVDDKEAPALGVLSQGELNAMTLSLFLPRVLLEATPFGFVIVDDPVQAMDEVRVDGLAQVLTEVGKRRQVVVFTHDARLPEAFERLALPHAKRRVNRGINSNVVVSSLIGPWEQRLEDATAVTLTPDLPEHIAGQVVPGFCRQALEAACVDGLRRRWLQRGDAHVDVERKLARRGLRDLLAFLFFEDASRHGALTSRLEKLKVTDAAAIVTDCQNGAHQGFSGNLKEMVARTRSLCDELRKVKAP